MLLPLITGVIVFLLLLFVAYIIVERLKKPHSKKMYSEQTELDKKTVTKETPVAVAATGAETPADKSPKPEKDNNPLWWTILLVIAGIAVSFWGLYASAWNSPHIADLGTWSWDHWLPLLILCGIIALLIAINAKVFKGAVKGALQSILVFVMFLLFIGFPVWSWLMSPSPGTPHHSSSRSEIPLASLPRSAWSKLIIPAGGKSERISVPQHMHVVMGGENFRFHCVYRDGHEESFGKGETPCSDGDMPFVYATNEDARNQNIVSYAYASN